jgi:hypothetical protein
LEQPVATPGILGRAQTAIVPLATLVAAAQGRLPPVSSSMGPERARTEEIVMVRPAARLVTGTLAAIAGAALVSGAAESSVRTRPITTLEPAGRIELPSRVDSNSPAYWALVGGRRLLHVINSSPDPMVSKGRSAAELSFTRPVSFDNGINGSRWMEAVVPDDDGTLYGYYHNEPSGACGINSTLTVPRIGAAVSWDNGLTWRDLGIILEAPPDSTTCSTPNTYDAGGVGDFSVMLDADGRDLYIFYSSFTRQPAFQGVSVARMLWSDRDQPRAAVSIWDDGIWRPAEIDEDDDVVYPAGTPIFPAAGSWHDASGRVDAFWGPSVHFNTSLNRYVMLLNHATSGSFTQEGIYVSSAASLEDPRGWPAPHRILSGGKWYPQVIGSEQGTGTDRLAGARARFFMGGVSEYEIVFTPADDRAVAR